VSRPAAVAILAALAIGLAWGVLSLFGARFEAGAIYPEFSSLRKDPAGTSVLFESLQRIAPATERSYPPFQNVAWSDRTVLLLGVDPAQLLPGAALDRALLEPLARKGNRVVLAFRGNRWAGQEVIESVKNAWHVEIQNGGTKDAPELHFRAGAEWNSFNGDPDFIERAYGSGSLVLLASSVVFLNATLADAPDSKLLAAIVGETSAIVFEEAHLGIVESGSVMGLLRTFRLEGIIFGLLLPFALCVWRYSTSFPPAAPLIRGQRVEGQRSFSGLVALLRRNLSPKDLAATCFAEWLKGAPKALPLHRRELAERELAARSAEPLLALRHIDQILSRKRND